MRFAVGHGHDPVVAENAAGFEIKSFIYPKPYLEARGTQ